jgi:hypothetical protein
LLKWVTAWNSVQSPPCLLFINFCKHSVTEVLSSLGSLENVSRIANWVFLLLAEELVACSQPSWCVNRSDHKNLGFPEYNFGLIIVIFFSITIAYWLLGLILPLKSLLLWLIMPPKSLLLGLVLPFKSLLTKIY